MTFETTLFILFLIGFFLLVYTIIVLVKRKEYENKRIFPGYNALVFGVIFLALSFLVKTLKFGFLAFKESLILDYMNYFDVATQIVLLPLFAVSLFVAMLLFKEI